MKPFAALVLSIIFTHSVAQEDQKKLVNTLFPKFEFTLLNGKVLTSGELNGKIIMLNFWSTSCAPCLAEIPHLNKLKEKYRDQIQFVAVAPLGDRTAISNTLGKHPFDFIIAYDSKGIFESLGISSYPKNFFIDAKGFVKAVADGTPYTKPSPSADWEISVVSEYSKIIDKLLSDK